MVEQFRQPSAGDHSFHWCLERSGCCTVQYIIVRGYGLWMRMLCNSFVHLEFRGRKFVHEGFHCPKLGARNIWFASLDSWVFHGSQAMVEIPTYPHCWLLIAMLAWAWHLRLLVYSYRGSCDDGDLEPCGEGGRGGEGKSAVSIMKSKYRFLSGRALFREILCRCVPIVELQVLEQSPSLSPSTNCWRCNTEGDVFAGPDLSLLFSSSSTV